MIASASRSKLAEGHHKVWGSMFAYRSMSAAAAIQGAVDGATPAIRPRPQDAADYFDRVARVQTVKCAPLGDRSNPTSAMNIECPATFLVEELAILRPRALVVFGTAAREAALKAIRRLGQGPPSWPRKTRGGYGRRQSLTPWGPLDLFSTWHPTYARWPQAQEALVADLRADPLNADADRLD